jgi:hypothetical protein
MDRYDALGIRLCIVTDELALRLFDELERIRREELADRGVSTVFTLLMRALSDPFDPMKARPLTRRDLDSLEPTSPPVLRMKAREIPEDSILKDLCMDLCTRSGKHWEYESGRSLYVLLNHTLPFGRPSC